MFVICLDHELLRRASVECMVNIVHHSLDIRDKFCQGDNERVKLWTLYCGEWEDNPDLALAAAGGLAILTEYSPEACAKIVAVASWMTILKVSCFFFLETCLAEEKFWLILRPMKYNLSYSFSRLRNKNSPRKVLYMVYFSLHQSSQKSSV